MNVSSKKKKKTSPTSNKAYRSNSNSREIQGKENSSGMTPLGNDQTNPHYRRVCKTTDLPS